MANAQTASNRETAISNAALNRIDQYTPYGSSTYSITGTAPDGTPTYSNYVNLAPEQQQLLDKYTQGQNTLADTALGSLGNVQSNFSKPFSLTNDPTTEDFTTTQRNAQDAAYKAATGYLDPRYAQDQESLDSKLANMGLAPGGAAYDRAQGDFQRNKDLAYSTAENQAYGQGLQAQNQNFNQDLAGASLQFAKYNQPLATYNSLITGSQPTNPTFNPVPGASQANTDVAGINANAVNAANARYQQQMAGYNNLFSLGGTLGAAAILA